MGKGLRRHAKPPVPTPSYFRRRRKVRKCVTSSSSLAFLSLIPSSTLASLTSGPPSQQSIPVAKSWAASNWTPGQVSLLEAFGIGGQFSFPQLSAVLPSAVNSTTPSSPSSSGSPSPTPSGGPVGTNQATYTQAQLQQLWIQAGGNPAMAKIASAIAMAESSGRSNASNQDSNGTTDEGLWQINTVHGSQATYDPLGNARSAVAISSNGTNWSPWTTFNNGAYLKYM